MAISLFTVLIVVVPLIIIGLISLLWSKRPKNSPPIARIGLPLIGNYVGFAKNPVDFMKACLDKYGPIYTVPILHQNMTFLLGPEVSAPFFQKGDNVMSQPEVYRFMTPVFGEGVVYDAEPKKRTQQYQTMAQGLKSRRLAAYIPKIEMETRQYLSNWGETGTVDLLQAMSELTILTSSRCLHGDDVRENLFADVARLYHDLDKGVTPISFFFPYAPTAAHKLRDNARKEMVNIFTKVIKKRKDSGVNSEQTTDILQVFIDLVYKDGTRLTDDQIVGLLIALLFAGQHTSTITGTWTAMFLLHHLRCKGEVMKEQEAIMGSDASKPLDFDSVGKMEYLQNCVKEALRMHPPLIMLMRMALEDVETISNGKKYLIPKGDIVVTSPSVASRMPTTFTRPNEYIPERFGPDESEVKVPFAFLGFGGGMHACVGQQFGLLQVKTILSVLFRNFKIEPEESQLPDPDYTAMVVGPKNRCKVRYTKLPSSTIGK